MPLLDFNSKKQEHFRTFLSLVITSLPKTVMKVLTTALLCSVLIQSSGTATYIVNDNWLDGDRSKTGALDSDWYTSSSPTGIEVSTGSLGFVTGSSGRGIHTTFATQSLAIGETLRVTYSFTTPTTIGSNKASAFRVGIFDTQERAGLSADLTASSGSPNTLYNGLGGYISIFDVNTGSTADIDLRKQDTAATTGRLMATTVGFDALGDSADTGYAFTTSQNYTGIFTITRTGADTTTVTSTLSWGTTRLDTHTENDISGSTYEFGLLAFHVNSNTFGSTSSQGQPDNGIDFSNVTVEFIPEPSMFGLIFASGCATLVLKRRQTES